MTLEGIDRGDPFVPDQLVVVDADIGWIETGHHVEPRVEAAWRMFGGHPARDENQLIGRGLNGSHPLVELTVFHLGNGNGAVVSDEDPGLLG